MGKKNTTPLTDIEWTTLWMAVRYAMNRQTIASASLPAEIISNYYDRLTDQQKRMIARDLRENEEGWRHDGKAFGNPFIDRVHWLRLWKALDEKEHFTVVTVDGETHAVFEVEGKVVPLGRYLAAPHCGWQIPAENIKEKHTEAQ